MEDKAHNEQLRRIRRKLGALKADLERRGDLRTAELLKDILNEAKEATNK